MLHSMRLRNLRSFSGDENSPYIDLKPLTVLVGKNSSGKSSFLRSLPLLRQSVEAKTSGPILWYGSYVDFGAFSEAKIYDSDIDTIFFGFKLTIKIEKTDNHFFNSYLIENSVGLNFIDVDVEIGVGESAKKTASNSVKLKFGEFEYVFKFSQAGKCSLTINNKEEFSQENLSYIAGDRFIPHIGKLQKFDRDITGQKPSLQRFNANFLTNHFSEKAKDFLVNYFHPSTAKETISEGISRMGVCSRKNLKNDLRNIFRKSSSFLKNTDLKWKEIEHEAYTYLTHKNLTKIINGVNQELENTFKSVRYIAPLRATAERYYRHQDLQIDEIDHTGSNLAMLLRSFSPGENDRFSNWTNINFGFKVRVEELGLHYALKIQTENDSREYNINDMGFGFSQILPIVASIWMETNAIRNRPRRSRLNRFIFTIEQPELHLHPEYQSKLAKMFAGVVKAAKESEMELVILFETHSKTMIDTLGDCIESKALDSNDVNIVIFEKEIGESNTLVKFSKFDETGNLLHWPIGFFSGR